MAFFFAENIDMNMSTSFINTNNLGGINKGKCMLLSNNNNQIQYFYSLKQNLREC